MANPKDKYGEPMKHRQRCCNSHHVDDGERFSWMRRWILMNSELDDTGVPRWNTRLWQKEQSLIKKERIRETRRAARDEWENLWSVRYPQGWELEYHDVDDEILIFNPVLLGGCLEADT